MTIGSDGADMVIDDPTVEPIHLQIEFTGKDFTIVNLHPKKKAQLNGKALKGKPLPFKSNDNVSVGGTTIFFMKVDMKNAMPPAPMDDSENLEKLQAPETALNAIWQSLDIMIEQQGGTAADSGNSGSPAGAPPPLPKG